MTQGFYEQLGARPDAEIDEIKAAYGRAVAHLLRRREATVTQGGDTSAIDLTRTQLDEAWAALSDPARRRRYDAMLAVAGDGILNDEATDLWSRVAGAMIHPSVAAAARLVDAATQLGLAPLPEPPHPVGGRRAVGAWTEEVTLASPVSSGFGAPRPITRPVEVAGANRPHQATQPGHTSPEAASEPGTSPGGDPSAGEIAQLFGAHGPTGALLRAVRQRRGLTLQQVSESTRISTRYLDAVEREDFSTLPSAAAFVRGYVREMCRLLGLDAEKVVAGYMRRFSGDG
jgi:hypothetical protein